MRKYYGCVSLEKVNIATVNERWACMLAENGTDKMWEIRPKNSPAFQSPQNSPFSQFIGKDVKVEGQGWKENVIIVSDIKKHP